MRISFLARSGVKRTLIVLIMPFTQSWRDNRMNDKQPTRGIYPLRHWYCDSRSSTLFHTHPTVYTPAFVYIIHRQSRNSVPWVYLYPICIWHYARMNRTGNRVPISGNIISVTRRTASGEYRPPPRGAVEGANSARLCAPPNMTENTWSQGKRVGKKVTDSRPAVFLRPESMCHLAIDVSRTLASASVTNYICLTLDLLWKIFQTQSPPLFIL